MPSHKNENIEINQKNDVTQRNDSHSGNAGAFVQKISDLQPQYDRNGKPITAENPYTGLGVGPEIVRKANKMIAAQIGGWKESVPQEELQGSVENSSVEYHQKNKARPFADNGKEPSKSPLYKDPEGYIRLDSVSSYRIQENISELPSQSWEDTKPKLRTFSQQMEIDILIKLRECGKELLERITSKESKLDYRNIIAEYVDYLKQGENIAKNIKRELDSIAVDTISNKIRNFKNTTERHLASIEANIKLWETRTQLLTKSYIEKTENEWRSRLYAAENTIHVYNETLKEALSNDDNDIESRLPIYS